MYPMISLCDPHQTCRIRLVSNAGCKKQAAIRSRMPSEGAVAHPWRVMRHPILVADMSQCSPYTLSDACCKLHPSSDHVTAQAWHLTETKGSSGRDNQHPCHIEALCERLRFVQQASNARHPPSSDLPYSSHPTAFFPAAIDSISSL